MLLLDIMKIMMKIIGYAISFDTLNCFFRDVIKLLLYCFDTI